MLKIFAFAFLASATLVGTSCAAEKEAQSPAADNQQAEDTNLSAVLVYADWCSSCKILDPKIKAIKAKEEFPGVNFVTIDYSDRDVEGLFKQADEQGVGDAIRTFLAEEVKTGQLLLVDLDDDRVIGKVVKSMEEAEITGAIKAAQLAS